PVPSTATAASSGEKKYKKALKWSMIKYEGSVLDKFRMLKKCGYDGVEIEAPNKLDPAEVVAAREATGLEVPGVVDSVHWKQTLSHPDAAVRAEGLAGLEQALRDCKAYGGTSCLLVP